MSDLLPHQQEFVLDPNAFELMAEAATEFYGKTVGDLSFDEASELVGGLIIALSDTSDSSVTKSGMTIADTKSDGREATSGAGRQFAKDLVPRIDDEREILVSVLRKPTLWDAIRHRPPRIGQTFHFHNEPPQYA